MRVHGLRVEAAGDAQHRGVGREGAAAQQRQQQKAGETTDHGHAQMISK
jgi:hypothetical protein